MTMTATNSDPCTSDTIHATYYAAKTDTITILHAPATTVIVNHTPDETSKSDRSLTVWMVVAILFIVIAISAIAFSISLGYVFHKKINTLKNSTIATSATNTELVTEGNFSHNN